MCGTEIYCVSKTATQFLCATQRNFFAGARRRRQRAGQVRRQLRGPLAVDSGAAAAVDA